MSVINIAQKFAQFHDHWSPKVIAELNGQAVKVAEVAGEFVWHDHTDEDELFLVFQGTLYIDFKDRTTVKLQPGEFYIVPRGVLHRPRTETGQEVHLLLLEPIATKHTGEVAHALTVSRYDRL
ncbi:hypothetical protein LEM8419_02869 [Neolewinella maritima]|uniref:Cupin type-2 domain-containing protein n=1 Tax=Neolewinella maritima TaxID=1383882 RepID=A0ABM9B447_9BACT|nr:cupin domain-containing protein [Neolewinella maritima]CAH1001954.1 hypothetical protein LEM8419_02869 [Neolewinella maritima]